MDGWKKEKLTSLGDFINGYAFKPDDWEKEGLPIIRIEQLKNPEKIYDFYNGNLPEYNIIDNGDLIFSWSASLFLSIWKHGKAALNQHLFKVVEKDGVDRKFLKYLIEFYLPVFEGASHGSTMKHITRKDLNTFEVILPSEQPEQSLIAEILSTADRAIEQTEAVIAKLQRIKTGLMQELLTKGIDEQGNIRSEETHEFKDSPLGRIPVGWEVGMIKKISKITTGDKDTQDKVDDGLYPFFVRSDKVERINTYSYDGEGILTSGDGVGVGKIYHYINGKFDFHQRVYLIYRFNKKIMGRFLFEYFRNNFYNEISKYSAKTTVDSVRLSIISDMLVPLPPINEQENIVTMLTTADTTIEKNLHDLNKLKKLKSALMQDLLTGRVRVTELLKKQQVEAAG